MTPFRPLDHRSLSPRKRRAVLKACALATVWPGLPAWAQTTPVRPLDVPFEPTPHKTVSRMLSLAGVGKNDLVYDLGCGDGRIVIAAAKDYGARGVGIDLDPKRIAEARANAREAGVEERVRFVLGDLFQTDFSDATVVTLFLFRHVNYQLRPELWRQLKVGTRVVSYVWDMGPEWPPEKTETVDGKTIYYWTINEGHKSRGGDKSRVGK